MVAHTSGGRVVAGSNPVGPNFMTFDQDQAFDTIYGIHVVHDLIQETGFFASDVLYVGNRGNPRIQKIILKAQKARIEIKYVSFQELDEKSNYNKHQGVLLHRTESIEFKELTSYEVTKNKEKTCLYVAIDGVKDPQNVGAIIRSMVALGASGLIYPQKKVSPLGSTVMKTSSGALAKIPILRVPGIPSFLKSIRDKDVLIIGSSLEGVAFAQDTLHEIKQAKNVVLILGSEDKGISEPTQELCNILVKIPQKDAIQSLNVASAASILIYELLKD